MSYLVMAINPFEPFLLSIVTGLLSLLVVFPSMYLLKDHLRATFCQHCCAALFALYRVAIGSRMVYNDPPPITAYNPKSQADEFNTECVALSYVMPIVILKLTAFLPLLHVMKLCWLGQVRIVYH